jgi:DNA phosphorothioation-associated putative methyltransferase
MVDTTNNLQQYRSSIEALRFGKRVGPFIYFHIDGLGELSSSIRALVRFASELAHQQSFEFNIVKAGTRQVSLSLLNYPGFWRQAFPVLGHSAKLDLEAHTIKIIDFSNRQNRPVLHRKELLLPPGHTHFDKFSALTAQAEELGLLKDSTSIGLERGWRKALKKANVKIIGHFLVPKEKGDQTGSSQSFGQIERHKTAMRRQHLSQPLQVLQKYGYVNGKYSLFDYGCGRGDDIEALKALAVPVTGWDPHYCPAVDKKPADIVNLGFVINVIEERKERDETLREAFGLAKKFVMVSALIGNPEYSGKVQDVGDGVVTSIGTFQKYYLPDELENYVRGVLNAPVIPVAQGVVLAFTSEEEADRFRARRVGARRTGHRGSLQQASDLFLLDEAARSVLAAYWDRCLALGREALASELSESAVLEPLGLSPSTAFRFLVDKLGRKELERAALDRKQDMLIQFALGQFDGRVYFKYMSEDVQKDISVFFGGFSSLQEQAKKLLFSIADTDLLMEGSQEASSEGYGYILPDDSLQLHASLIERLPAILQVYIGCALRLVGGVGRAELIKIHILTGKLSLMTYDDFDGQAIPHLVERIKVNLWKRRTEYFDYIAGFVPPPLLMKSLFLPEDHENFDEQSRFDGKLMKAGLFDVTNPHPTRREFEAALEIKGLKVQGFDLINGKR